jgi:alkanesulfonate monooxygenase SsuD/methylene tetrahydromethanopterin reductase-like flavin-dependent oxidoreductase (luciferase family)
VREVHPFRFGVIAAPRAVGADGGQWLGTARRTADLGFGTLLVPDGLALHAPLPALAVAAAVPELRLGTFVLAAPLRPPRLAAWEAHSLTALTGGRFEFGIGTGRPAARGDVEEVGRSWGTGAGRLAAVRATIAHLRALDGDRHTPVLVAAGGPKALELAAAEADVVTFATSPLVERAELARLADTLRDRAGERAGHIELALNLYLIGEETPPWARQVLGVDPALLRDRDTLAALRGSPAEMADELLRRRDTLGFSYIVVSDAFIDVLAPVVERLAGT